MTTSAFDPKIWDASVYRTLEDNLVGRKICNSKPTGQVKGAGDTVYFNGLADPTISAYTGTLSYETLSDSQIALLIDQQNSYSFKVSDVEQAMANVDLKGSQTERAAYMIKRACDTYIMGLYTQAAAGTVTDATCDSATILSDVATLAQYLMEQNVDENNMWMTIPPWVMIKLKLAGISFSINEGINGKGGMQWTKDLGFDVFVTNQVVNTGSAAAPVSHLMAGSYQAIAFADKLNKSRAMELEGSFEIGVSGLHVFGAKVVKPKELATATLTFAAETAI